MSHQREKTPDVEVILHMIADLGELNGGGEQELGEEDLDLVLAAAGIPDYAAFLRRAQEKKQR